jgi:transcription initiation factor TFIIE subunit alpha
MGVKIKNEVEEVLAEICGADVVPLVRALKNRENVSEFSLATKLKIEINKVRNALYRLYELGLVRFIRKKDKKKGWYIYYWTFNTHRIDDLLRKVRTEKLERLEKRLNRESNNQFFACPQYHVRLDFDSAAGYNYKCPECNVLLDQEDNSRTIENLNTQINELKKLIAAKPKPIKKAVKKVKKKAVKKKVKKKVKKTSKVKKAVKKVKKKVKKVVKKVKKKVKKKR